MIGLNPDPCESHETKAETGGEGGWGGGLVKLHNCVCVCVLHMYVLMQDSLINSKHRCDVVLITE